MDTQPNIQKSRRLPRQKQGGNPLLLGSKIANLLLGCCEALLNIKVYVQQTNGTSTLPPIEGEVIITEHGLTITLPPAQAGVGGTSGMRWANPIEGSAKAYTKGDWIHLTATNSLVTVGIRDAANPTGAVVKAKSGRWCALRDVPDKTSVGGNDVWNLPQWPMPDPTNYDAAENYWAFFPDPVCV